MTARAFDAMAGAIEHAHDRPVRRVLITILVAIPILHLLTLFAIWASFGFPAVYP